MLAPIYSYRMLAGPSAIGTKVSNTFLVTQVTINVIMSVS
jgi:hypothetical protein